MSINVFDRQGSCGVSPALVSRSDRRQLLNSNKVIGTAHLSNEVLRLGY
ncbi:hypothetical protein [Chamaesiphon sp. OTE_20_metabat_361]|nr:hypothetical protein [Chamaesiphon sp. OTE_20_metabat_361]